MTRAIVFDFDGVIVDSEPLHERALREVARRRGMDFSHDRYLQVYVGFDDRDTFRAIAADHGRPLDDADLADLLAQKADVFEGLIADGQVSAYPGSAELVRAAADAGPVGICSGARRREIEITLSLLGLRDAVRELVSADDVARSKPDPEGYLLAARRLGVPASGCVALEDTPTGVRAARAAGYRVVGVCHTFDASTLREAHAVVPETRGLTPSALLRA